MGKMTRQQEKAMFSKFVTTGSRGGHIERYELPAESSGHQGHKYYQVKVGNDIVLIRVANNKIVYGLDKLNKARVEIGRYPVTSNFKDKKFTIIE